MPTLTTNLWFDTQAEQAAAFYTGLLGGSVHGVLRYGPNTPGPEDTVMTVNWDMLGQQFTGINGGPEFQFTEAISLEVQCADQQELDRIWNALVGGGEPGPCGWLKDRYGLSWQVTPVRLFELLNSDDAEAANRATQVMLATANVPLNIAALEAAYAGQ